MQAEVQNRFNSLLLEGEQLIRKLPRAEYGLKYWIEDKDIPEYQVWLGSVANLLRLVAIPDSYYFEECKRLTNHSEMSRGIPLHIVQKMFGLLKSAKKEWEEGLLRRIEYIVSAATFDDFLDHAALYHKGDKKIESSVLASAVLEDKVKKIATKHGIRTSGISLEQLIDDLVKAEVFTMVKAKRVKGYAGVRNHSLHAEWDEFDIRDVGELIKGTRDLIEEFL